MLPADSLMGAEPCSWSWPGLSSDYADAPLDLERVGVATGEPGGPLGEGDFVVDTAAPGLHGGGHPFLANLGDAEARAVIEYLKTL